MYHHNIKNSSDLVEYFKAFPDEVALLESSSPMRNIIEEVLGIKTEFNLVASICETPILADILLKSREQGGFRDLITEYRSLHKLVEVVPAQAENLLKPQEEDGFRDLITNIEELLEIIEIAPSQAESLLKSEEEGGLLYLIRDHESLLEVLKVAPAQAERLLKPKEEGGLRHLTNDYDALVESLNGAPIQADSIFSFQQEVGLDQLIAMIKAAPEQVENLLRPQEEGGSRHLIRDWWDLVDVIRAAPILMMSLLNGPRNLRYFIAGYDCLVEILKVVPTQAENLLKPEEGGFRHLIINGLSLANIIKAVPAQAENLLKPIDEDGFRHLITDWRCLASIIKAAPKQAENLLKSRQQNGFSYLIEDKESLLAILKVAPGQAEALLIPQEEDELCSESVSSSSRSVLDILRSVPGQRKLVFNPQEQKQPRDLITDGEFLLEILQVAPALAGNLLQAGPAGFRHLITDVEILVKIVKVAPEFADNLLKPQEENGFRHLIVDEKGLLDILEVAPGLAKSLLKPSEEGGLLSEQITIESILAQLSAKELIVILQQNLSLFVYLENCSYLFHEPGHVIGYCYAAFCYQLNKLSVEKDVNETFLDLQEYLHKVRASMTSKGFDSKVLSNFIDLHRKSTRGQLLIAMILSSDEGLFHELTHPAQDNWLSQACYQVNRLLDATNYAYSAFLHGDNQLSALAKVCLFHCKIELSNGLSVFQEITHRGEDEEHIKKRIEDRLRKLDSLDLNIVTWAEQQKPLPPIDQVIRQPNACSFFLSADALNKFFTELESSEVLALKLG